MSQEISQIDEIELVVKTKSRSNGLPCQEGSDTVIYDTERDQEIRKSMAQFAPAFEMQMSPTTQEN